MMGKKINRRDFQKVTLTGLGAALLVSCRRAVRPAPTAPAASATAPSAAAPQPAGTNAPAVKDIPVYRNSFEDLTDPQSGGITSDNALVKISTANVKYGSGNQSLEVRGNLGGTASSALDLDFSIKKLTGEESIDPTNKTVSYSAFLPADSAVDGIGIQAGKGGRFVFLGGMAADDNEWKKEAWHEFQFDLKAVPGLMKDCDMLRIAGWRSSGGSPAETGFFADDLRWIGIDDLNHVPLDAGAESIRKYADRKRMKIGSVLFNGKYINWFKDPWYLYTLAREFNMTTAGGVDWPEARPVDDAPIDFDYGGEDQKAAFAEGNGLFLRGGTGGFRTGNSLWLMDAGYDELKSFLERKIEQDIGHFGGKVFSWGVFNEVVNDEGTGFYNRQNKNPNDPNASPYAPYGWQYSPWVDGKDTSLIEAGFFKARQVDPDAKLYLNEYANEEIGGKKADFFYNFAAGMKKRGVPIDGAGFQLHLMFPRPTAGFAPDLENLDAYLDRVDRNIKRYAAADLLVEFTEFECQIRLDNLDLGSQTGRDEHARRVRKQAEIYAGFMKLAKKNPNVASFTIWTVADKPHTSGFDSPWNAFTDTDAFLFDAKYNPKPAYFALLQELKS